MPPLIAEEIKKEDLLQPIRSIHREIAVRRREDKKQLANVNQSFVAETFSNAVFATVAIAVDMPGTETALAAAAFVYVPIAYEWTTTKLRLSELEKKNDEYRITKDTRVYDDAGSTFRGSNDIGIEEHHEPFFSFKSTFDPLPLKGNKGGLIGSAKQYVCASAILTKDLITQLDNNNVPSERVFVYLQDPCAEYNTVVMRTSMSNIMPNTVAQLPADPERVENIIKSTKRNIKGDITKLFFHAVGSVAAGEFCVTVGKSIINDASTAFETGSLFHGVLSAGWGLAVLVGMGPLKHFLDDSVITQQRLSQRFAALNVKREAKKQLIQTRDGIKKGISEFNVNDEQGQHNVLPAIKDHLAYLITKIDTDALDETTMAFFKTQGISTKTAVFEFTGA